MANMNIDDKVYKKWNSFYDKHSKIKYPTLKNFTERKMMLMVNEENII